jgi:hypothetical protein
LFISSDFFDSAVPLLWRFSALFNTSANAALRTVPSRNLFREFSNLLEISFDNSVVMIPGFYKKTLWIKVL